MGDIIVLSVLAGVVILAVRSMIKSRKSGCCGSCSGCSGNCAACSRAPRKDDQNEAI